MSTTMGWSKNSCFIIEIIVPWTLLEIFMYNFSLTLCILRSLRTKVYLTAPTNCYNNLTPKLTQMNVFDFQRLHPNSRKCIKRGNTWAHSLSACQSPAFSDISTLPSHTFLPQSWVFQGSPNSTSSSLSPSNTMKNEDLFLYPSQCTPI